jgi:hypothetical protein
MLAVLVTAGGVHVPGHNALFWTSLAIRAVHVLHGLHVVDSSR